MDVSKKTLDVIADLYFECVLSIEDEAKQTKLL